jgi:hypothetical protein
MFIACILAAIPAVQGQDQEAQGHELPPLPSLNATHFVVLASATGDEKGVRLRIVMPVSGPKGPERWMQKTAIVDDKNWRVLDSKGGRVDPKSLTKALKKLTPVLLSLEQKPDPFNLQTTKPETLIIIAPKDAIQNLENVGG